MGFINKGDVKNHLSLRERNGKRLFRAVGPTDATGYLGQKHRSADLPPEIAKSPEQPAVPEVAVAPPEENAGLNPFLVPPVSKSAQQ